MTANTKSKGRVAILAENGYQEMELWVPLYRLREEGYETVIVGPAPGTYNSKCGYPATATQAAGETDPASLAGVVIAT